MYYILLAFSLITEVLLLIYGIWWLAIPTGWVVLMAGIYAFDKTV